MTPITPRYSSAMNEQRIVNMPNMEQEEEYVLHP